MIVLAKMALSLLRTQTPKFNERDCLYLGGPVFGGGRIWNPENERTKRFAGCYRTFIVGIVAGKTIGITG